VSSEDVLKFGQIQLKLYRGPPQDQGVGERSRLDQVLTKCDKVIKQTSQLSVKEELSWELTTSNH